MTTPTGQISFTNLVTEFGLPVNKNLGAYRVSQTIGDRTWPLDTGVPTSGTIRFSDLRGKTCNVVVDYGTGADIITQFSGTTTSQSVVNHEFNDNTNQNVTLTSSSTAIAITAQNLADEGGTLDTVDRKHYVVTVNDGTVVETGATNFDLVNLAQRTGDVSDPLFPEGEQAIITVSKKEKISANQFRVWFLASPDPLAPPGSPTIIAGNSYCRQFTFLWTSVVSGGVVSTAKTIYTTNGTVVGGFKPLPGPSESKKVISLVRRRIGNGLQTGVWDSNTLPLEFRITGSGALIGRGGRGANGSGSNGYGTGGPGAAQGYQNGEPGYPALYASHPCSIILESSTARLQGGGGGGGGGGGACCDPDNNPQDPSTGGGGGGGGAGLPAGGAGPGAGNAGAGYGNTDGTAGSVTAGGQGGNGGSTVGVQGPRNCAGGGGGGGGSGPEQGNGGQGRVQSCGDITLNGEAGQTGRGGNASAGRACGREGYRSGGQGGPNGYATLALSGIVVNITNTGGGTVFGAQGTGSF